jgi:peptidoglycan/LPS O-acetylase OafA/YrhL
VRAQPWSLVAATVALALGVALAAYRWVARPMTTALTRAVSPRRPARRPIET